MAYQVQIRNACEYWDAEASRVGMVLFCKTVDNERVAVRVRGIKYFLYMQLPDNTTSHQATLWMEEWHKELSAAMRRRLQSERRCGRTNCTCTLSAQPTLNFSTQPCMTALKTASCECTESRLVYRYPLVGYRKDPAPYIEFTVSEACFANYAEQFLYKKIDSMGWRDMCEISSIKDTAFAFLYYTARLDPLATPDTGAKTAACLRWISFDGDLVRDECRITRSSREYIVDVNAITVLHDTRMTCTDTVSLDIECRVLPGDTGIPTPDRREIISVQLDFSSDTNSSYKGSYVIAYFAPPPPTDEYVFVSVRDERELLLALRKLLIEKPPDFIGGHNINNFDFPYIFERAARCCDEFFDFSYLKRMRTWSYHANRSSSAFSREVAFYNIPGIVIMDTMVIAQKNDNFPSYTLNYVAKARLGEEKVEFPITRSEEYINGTDEQRAEFCHYGVVDVKLPTKLLKSYGAQQMYSMYASMYGVFPDHLLTRGMQAYLLPAAMAFGYANNYVVCRHRTIYPEKEQKKDIVEEALQAAFDMADEYAGETSESNDDFFKDANDKHDDDDNDNEPKIIQYKSFNEIFGKRRKKKAAAASDAKPPPHIPAYTAIPGYSAAGGDVTYEGAIVMDPVIGYHVEGPVLCDDFASLYPTTMCAHNISPDTLVIGVHDTTPSETTPYGDRFVLSSVKVGLFPKIVKYLLAERKKAKAELARAKQAGDASLVRYYDSYQSAVKVGANSMYGALGASTSWASCVFAARAITKYGQQAILRVRKFVEEELVFWLKADDARVDEFRRKTDTKGQPMIVVDPVSQREKFNVALQVVYGDTDSIMTKIILPGLVVDGKLDVALALQLNSYITDEINSRGFFQKPMEIAAECAYYPYILLGKKTYGATKYESTKPGSSKRIVKGLANVRREYPFYTRKTLDYLLDMILAAYPVTRILDEMQVCIQRLLSEEVTIETMEERFRRTVLEDHAREQERRREASLGAEERAALEAQRSRERQALDAARSVPKPPGKMRLEDLEMSQALRKKLPPTARPKGAKVPSDEYADAHSNNHVHVAVMWRDDPEHAATCPRFGDRVPYFFAMVPGCTKKAASRCVPPYAITPSQSRPLPLLLDRVTYLERKFKKPISKIMGVMCDPEQLRVLFLLDRYKRATGFCNKTNRLKWVRPASRKRSNGDASARGDGADDVPGDADDAADDATDLGSAPSCSTMMSDVSVFSTATVDTHATVNTHATADTHATASTTGTAATCATKRSRQVTLMDLWKAV